MKKPILILFTACFVLSICAVPTTYSEEFSYKAGLVKESLLLDIANNTNSIIVGERGHVLINSAATNDTTQNLIADYTQVIVPTKTTLTAVTGINELAWVVGHDATILGSIDAGVNWELLHHAPELDRPLLDIHFFNPSHGIAVGAYGLFYRTEDGGRTWVQEYHSSVLSQDDKEYLESIKTDEAFYLEELSFISPHFNRLHDANGTLYLAGEAGLVAISNDQGHSWERLNLNYLGSFFDVAELPSKDILAVGLRGNMFLLSDGEWNSIATCITTSLNSVLVSQEDVFVVGNNGVILRLDMNQLTDSTAQEENSEGCSRHAAISQVPTTFSDAISSAAVMQNNILALTSAGIKKVGLHK